MSFEYAIYLGASTKAVYTDLAKVENVTIFGNSFNTILGPAIRLTDKAYHTSIIRNTFKDCSCTRFAGFDRSVIVPSVESRTTLSNLKVKDNRFLNDRYQHGKYGVTLYNCLSDVLVSGNLIKLATDRQVFMEPRIQKEHVERKDIIVK